MNSALIVSILKNKKANFLYEILETYECGIVLYGFEVKSVKSKQCNFTNCYARVSNKDEILLYNMYIAPYKFAPLETYDPIRIRKLLLHTQEIQKIKRKINEKGFTLVPIEAYVKNGLIKLSLGVGKGKKLYQKKEIIAERMVRRDIDRETKRIMKK